MKCLFCKGESKEWDKPSLRHLVITKNLEEQHIHVHGNIDDKDLVKELLHAAADEVHVPLIESKSERKEIVFHNRQRIGDMLMFTCAVRDFKAAFPDVRINVISTAAHIFDNNPYIDRTLVPTDENTIKIGPGKLTNQSNRLDWHFTNAFRVSIEDALGVHIPQGESRADIWLTQEEYDAPRVFEQPYWLIVLTGEKGWGCKMYPFAKWQEFINQNPDTTFVQLGAKEDEPPRLQGKNVIDYVGQTQSKETGIRDLFKLFLNAEGSIGLVSFHMHLSGALNKPTIVVAGAREPVSFTRYPGQQYIANDGCLPCAVNACWHCGIDNCKALIEIDGEKIPKCVDMITPADLTHALNQYYIGGRLKKGVASAKPKLKNIVKAKATPAEVPKKDEDIIAPYDEGSLFSKGTITKGDWEFIRSEIEKYKPKTFIEFGCGLSTFLLSKHGKVVSFETQQGWIDSAKKKYGEHLDIRLWDGKSKPTTDRFDFAFVDGPAGGDNREFSTKYAGELADIVITHDGWGEFDKLWQQTYLAPNFEASRGKGTRSADVWIKKVPAIAKPGTKFIKLVSTARGWGGCARSITTIMKFLIRAGHKVEFIPFRNKVSSGEFKGFIDGYLPGLIVSETYDTIKEACDVLFVYADDFVWEFNKPEIVEAFSGINAAKKIMMLNYRRGGVGEIPWTRGWDKYMFLNSTQEAELLAVQPGVKTKVLPPCTELEVFLNVKPDYNKSLRIVRHNSQGDAKFDVNVDPVLIRQALERPDATIAMLPGPTFVEPSERFIRVGRTGEAQKIADFLAQGNLFWYSLPKGYQDQGPRVVIEAMAAGLPILADKWGGAIDRVPPECGWLCETKEQMVEVIKNVSFEELQRKGKAAREHALKTFIPERWLEEILI